MNYTAKRAIVCGMALSGISAAKLLKSKGAFVTLQDIKTEETLNLDIRAVKETGIDLYLGKNPEDIILNYDLMVISPGLNTELSFIQKAVKSGMEVIGEFELGYRFCKCPVLAVTGTNGKTSTTVLLGKIVKSHLQDAEVVGNIGVPFTEKANVLPENSMCVAEVSSFQLESAQTFKPLVAAVLNITPDHLDRHKTFENYVAIKGSIAKNQTEGDFLILNYEDRNCRKIAETARSKVIFFSSENILDEGIYLNGGYIHLRLDGMDADIIAVDELKVLGKHNYENVMAACLMAYCAKIPLKNIINESLKFCGVEHRIEYVTSINDIEFYNDSKGTNPDAAVKSLEAMKRPAILIGGGYDKDADFTRWIQKFDKKVKALILLGQVAPKIAKTCEDMGYKNYICVNDLEEAVNQAYQKAVPGDAVLLSPACASWDMFNSYEERGNLFKSLVLDIKG